MATGGFPHCQEHGLWSVPERRQRARRRVHEGLHVPGHRAGPHCHMVLSAEGASRQTKEKRYINDDDDDVNIIIYFRFFSNNYCALSLYSDGGRPASFADQRRHDPVGPSRVLQANRSQAVHLRTEWEPLPIALHPWQRFVCLFVFRSNQNIKAP